VRSELTGLGAPAGLGIFGFVNRIVNMPMHYDKIFRSVVIFLPIDMIHVFVLVQSPSQYCLHYKTMF